jgi:hypothetical protein
LAVFEAVIAEIRIAHRAVKVQTVAGQDTPVGFDSLRIQV